MSYITFAEYTQLGGTVVSESVFAKIDRQAERKLDYFTQDRLKTATTIVSEVKELLVEFIDRMYNLATVGMGGNVTAYSNGIESFSFAENQTDSLNTELYNLAIEYLPIELISACVEVE